MNERLNLTTLIDEVPVALFCYHVATGRLTYVNRKLAESLGYTAREVLELDNVTDIVTEDQRGVVQEMIRRREAGDDREVRYHTKVRCRDGSVKDAEVHSVVVDAGVARIVIGVAVDVTTQMASRRGLVEREEYFRALTEHLSDVIAIVGSDCALTYVSPSASRVLGYETEQLLGGDLWSTVHPDDAERLRNLLLDLKRGATTPCIEIRFRHKNGNWRTLEVDARNLLGHPQIRGLVLDLRDVTDRKRMERELAQLNRLTSLGRLAAQVAHEFNNVMMGIQPMAEAIRLRAGGDAALLRAADVISAAIQRGKRITTDILRFSRPAQLTLRPVDVNELLRRAADEIRPLLGDGIQLELSLHDAALHVCADPAQLTQALVNLAVNARDAMESGGTVRLEARRAREGEGAVVHIAVADSGCGIAAGDLPYIFEPLFTTKHRGTGLGLSVVYQVIAAHRGRISVDSEPGSGTTFHLLLPSLASDCEEIAPETPADARLHALRVLIVDDEESITTGLRGSLEANGANVHCVATGAEVLPALAAFAPSIVILDLSLPDEDGRSVYNRIAAVSPVPVIFSSGHASESDIDKLLAPAHTAFLMKPYATGELLQTIHRLLGEEVACAF
ncbi:MAG TPA: PAS domain S-box protein [Thermoanaerobaculia bacterium]|nr:PAS domain S-box protein [Thermoanaerobaculia bacterium]